MTQSKQRLAVLGSTGSIGTQTLDIVRRYGDRFEITTLSAHSNWKKLVEQAVEFTPDNVVIADKTHYTAVRDALADHPVKVYVAAMRSNRSSARNRSTRSSWPWSVTAGCSRRSAR